MDSSKPYSVRTKARLPFLESPRERRKWFIFVTCECMSETPYQETFFFVKGEQETCEGSLRGLAFVHSHRFHGNWGKKTSQNHFPTSKKTPFRKRKDNLFTYLNFTMSVNSPRHSEQRIVRLFSSQRNDLLYGRRWTKQVGVIPNVCVLTELAFQDRTVLENPRYCTCWPLSHMNSWIVLYIVSFCVVSRQQKISHLFLCNSAEVGRVDHKTHRG